MSNNASTKYAFTLAEGRVDKVHFNTWKTAKGGQIQDIEREGRLACTTTQAPAKAQRCQYVIASECEAIQPIEKAGLEQQNTGLIHVKNLFPYFPVLDLLHAHGDSPEERCSSRLVPFAIRTRFAPSVRKSANPLFPCSKRVAFTLAEVLITLAVIGIVAALTLPGLIQNHNEKAWSTAKDLWEKKLTETVRRMNVDGVMTGHDTTEAFMNTFKNYMKVIKTCDNSELNKCYSPEFVLTGKRDNLEKKYIEDFKTAGDLGITDWNTNTISFVVADGTTVIMAYNPKCPYADPVEDTGSQVSCISMMIDVNGKKSPNRVGKDILLSNATISTCDNPIGDMCLSTSLKIEKIDTCDGTSPYDSFFSYDNVGNACENNYWAGAVKTCKDNNMELPTGAQFAEIANNLYVDRNGDPIKLKVNGNKSNIKFKDEYKDNPPIALGNYWVNDDQGSFARMHYFGGESTSGNSSTSKHNSAARNVLCISN